VKRITLAQGTPEWKLWRRGGVGGSDIAAICGLSPFEDHTRAVVLAEKVHGTERVANFAMNRGTRLEPHARLLYERRHSTPYHRLHARPVCVEMDDCPWARVSLDGLCDNAAAVPSERVAWLLELKCPGWETHSAALCGVVPDYYECQCQWQMLVAGVDHCDFATFNPSERFTPDSWELPWNDLLALIDAGRPHPPAEQWPADWMAEVRLDARPEMQAWLLDEAARFWFEVEEARAAMPAPAVKDWSRAEASF
jgi:putative phage-type endonuclease